MNCVSRMLRDQNRDETTDAILFSEKSSVEVKRLGRYYFRHNTSAETVGEGEAYGFFFLLHASLQPIFNSFQLKVANPSNCVFSSASCLHLSQTE